MESTRGRLVRLLDRGAIIAFSGAVAGILPVVILFFFSSWPAVDDVFRFFRVRRHGVWDAVYTEYQEVTGRWAGVGLSHLTSWFVDIGPWYPWILIAITGFVVISIERLIQVLAEGQLQARYAWAAAAVFFVLFWTGMCRPADSLYHFTFAIENLLSVGLAVMLIAMLLRLTPGRGGLAAYYLTVAAFGIWAFVAVGIHELYGSILLMVLVGGSFQAYRHRCRNRSAWLATAACAAIGLGVVVLAPGNWAKLDRLASDSEVVGQASHLEMAANQFTDIVTAWPLDLRLIGAGLLLIVAKPILDLRLSWAEWRGARWGAVVTALLVASVTFGLALPIWARSNRAVPRVLNGLYLVFLLACLVYTLLLARAYAKSLLNRSSVRLGLRLVAAMMFIAGLGLPTIVADWHKPPMAVPNRCRKGSVCSGLFRSNLNLAIEDLRYRLWPYHVALQERWQYLKERGGQDHREQTIIVEPLPPTPFMVRSVEVSTDWADRYNRALAYYFGVEAIRRPDPFHGEICLGMNRLGSLVRSSAADISLSADGDQLRFRPSLKEEAPEATVWIEIADTGPHLPSGASARLQLSSSADPVEPILLFMELWSGSGANRLLLGRAEASLKKREEWVALKANALPQTQVPVKAIALGAKVAGITEGPRPEVIVADVQLLPRH